jgi:PhnB protein
VTSDTAADPSATFLSIFDQEPPLDRSFKPEILGTPPPTQGVIPHVVVDDARKAIAFYKAALGASEVMRVAAPDGSNRLMHAELAINGARFFLVDHFPEHCPASPAEAKGQPAGKFAPAKEIGGTPATFHLYVENCDAAVKRAKEAGATVTMEPWDAFWGDRYAQVVDPFGLSWSFAHPLAKAA